MLQRKPFEMELPRPYDLDLEQQLIGELLMRNEALEAVASFLLPEHFAEELHGRIYYAIKRAVLAGQPANPFTLRNELESDPGLASVGGVSYLANLVTTGRNCLDPVKWAKQVYSLAFRRRLVVTARDIQAAAQDASIEFTPEKIAEYAESLLTEATGDSSPNAAERFVGLGKVASQVLRELDGQEVQPSVKYGIKALDDTSGGMRPKELIIIGARPGMGKTAVAAHVAKSAAMQGVGVGFFSMEMSAPSVTLRILTSMAFRRDRDGHDANPAYEAARRGQMPFAHKQELYALEGQMQALPLRIHEGRGLTPNGIILAAKRLRSEFEAAGHRLGLVVVDHLQKIRPDRDLRGNKVAEMTEISDALQKMAGNLDIPVVALSQLNRETEKRNDKRPELGDLRESGSIEQDADVVLLLYREAYYHKKNEPDRGSHDHGDWFSQWLRIKNRLDIQVAKQRNGPEGKHTVFFDAPSSALSDY